MLARRLALLAVLLCAAPSLLVRADDAPIVAAAANLKLPLEELTQRFRTETGREVRLVFGSSGNLYRQIEQGAPFQVFLSADEESVFRLAASGRAEDRGVPYAIGRIVLYAPHGSPLEVDEAMEGLRKALEGGRVRRFAIANPELAPYGRAAEEALRRRGLWERIRPKLVFGENVSQATQFASGGSAEGGIFAYSQALTPQVSAGGRYVVLPQALHGPIRQRMVLVKGAGETARRFYRYVQEPTAREVLQRYGYDLPEQ